MITESFLNNCFGLVLGKKQHDLDDTTYQDLLHYLKFVEKQSDSVFEIPIPIMNKFDMMKHICELKVSNGSFLEFLSSLQHSEKYKQHADFVEMKMSEEVSSQNQAAHEKTIHSLVQFCNINSTYNGFEEYLETTKRWIFR